jgi:amino acid transporter
MPVSPPLINTLAVKFFVVVFVFFVFTAFMWRYLEESDWGRFDFLRESLLARLLTGIVVAYAFWIFLSILFGTVNSWLFSPYH